MKTKILLPIFALFMLGMVYGQTLSTNEAKIVLVVDAKSERVSHITLLTNIQKMDEPRLLKKYGDCKFYGGLLKGSYELKENDIIPTENTTVIMFTEKQIFPKTHFYSSDDLAPGDSFDIGKTKAKVVSNKKGELILKT